jgi:hypothetical protein
MSESEDVKRFGDTFVAPGVGEELVAVHTELTRCAGPDISTDETAIVWACREIVKLRATAVLGKLDLSDLGERALEVLVRLEWTCGDVSGTTICADCAADKYPGGLDNPSVHKPGCEWGELVAELRRRRLGATP